MLKRLAPSFHLKFRNKIVYLNLKFKDDHDDFSKTRPFLVWTSNEKKAILLPITSQKKKKTFKWQYLISSPKFPTCLTNKLYSFAYANLNRQIIVEFKRRKSFSSTSFCQKFPENCLPDWKFINVIQLHIKYWRSSLNKIIKEEDQSKPKKIKVVI